MDVRSLKGCRSLSLSIAPLALLMYSFTAPSLRAGLDNRIEPDRRLTKKNSLLNITRRGGIFLPRNQWTMEMYTVNRYTPLYYQGFYLLIWIQGTGPIYRWRKPSPVVLLRILMNYVWGLLTTRNMILSLDIIFFRWWNFNLLIVYLFFHRMCRCCSRPSIRHSKGKHWSHTARVTIIYPLVIYVHFCFMNNMPHASIF